MCKAHYWLLTTPTHGEHIIGRCKYCRAIRDFTILLEQDQGYRQICLADTLTRPEISMDRIMLVKKPRGRPSNYSRVGTHQKGDSHSQV